MARKGLRAYRDCEATKNAPIRIKLNNSLSARRMRSKSDGGQAATTSRETKDTYGLRSADRTSMPQELRAKRSGGNRKPARWNQI